MHIYIYIYIYIYINTHIRIHTCTHLRQCAAGNFLAVPQRGIRRGGEPAVHLGNRYVETTSRGKLIASPEISLQDLIRAKPTCRLMDCLLGLVLLCEQLRIIQC